MLEGLRIAVVVPAFDEERWIEGAITTMPSWVDAIVVIDDASTDRTAMIARAAANGRATVLHHPHRSGVGAAIATGYRWAMLRADVVAVMAGDGQMHPGDLEAVLRPILRGDADYVKGDRLRHPQALTSMPLARRAGTRAFAWLTRIATGLPALSDSQCGFTAITSGAIAAIDLADLWPGYGYPNDLLGAVTRAHLRVAEVAVRPVYRGEKSGIRAYHLPLIGYVIARIAARRLIAPIAIPRRRTAPSTRTVPASPPRAVGNARV